MKVHYCCYFTRILSGGERRRDTVAGENSGHEDWEMGVRMNTLEREVRPGRGWGSERGEAVRVPVQQS